MSDDLLNEWNSCVKCLFLSSEKKITLLPATPTLLNLPLVTVVLYVLINTFFSRLHFIWYRKFAPCRPRPLPTSFFAYFSSSLTSFCHSFPPSWLIPKTNARTYKELAVYKIIYACSPRCTHTRYILLYAIRDTIMCKGTQKYFSLLNARDVLIH